jgi:EpsI family protein
VVRQYALVLGILLLVWGILGGSIVRVLAFPLLFLFFAVPFGEFLVPPLMELTADVTVSALRLSGIPVYREGLYFTLPAGSWSEVEACSGLRYLIASLTLGVLYAYLTYRGFLRRAVFVAFSIIVPVVANWMRAYLIVMIGHLSDMKLAVGVDHLIYGWLFFGVVMLILFWIGSHWREDEVSHETRAPINRPLHKEPALVGIVAATIASAGIVMVGPLAAAGLEAINVQVAPTLQNPPGAGAWRPLNARITDWAPRFSNAQAYFHEAYTTSANRVGLYVGYYRNQREGAELITSQNTLVHNKQLTWGNIGEASRVVVFDNKKLHVIEARLRGQSRSLLVWRWYWVDGRYVVNSYWAKLLQAKSKLLGNGDDAAVVIVYTEIDMSAHAPATVLTDFLKAMLPGITTSLNRTRGS